jgi:hypothetical protein
MAVVHPLNPVAALGELQPIWGLPTYPVQIKQRWNPHTAVVEQKANHWGLQSKA